MTYEREFICPNDRLQIINQIINRAHNRLLNELTRSPEKRGM